MSEVAKAARQPHHEAAQDCLRTLDRRIAQLKEMVDRIEGTEVPPVDKASAVDPPYKSVGPFLNDLAGEVAKIYESIDGAISRIEDAIF